MKYPRYPKYRPSTTSFVREVPDHWEFRRLKTIASVFLSNVDKKSIEGQATVRLCNYMDVYKHERITADLPFMAATATREQVQRFALHRGDVLVTKDSESWTDIAVPAVVAEEMPSVLCGYHLALIRPLALKSSGSYLARAFSAAGLREQFYVAANGITRFGLGGDALRTAQFPAPPLEEQSSVARFLDAKTAEIDALIAKKEWLVELLEEKRAALITHAVTKGLDPDVPMQNTGTVGLIPAHWKPSRLSYLTDETRPIMYGIVLPGPHVPGGVPIVKGGDVTPRRLKLELLSRTTVEIESGYVRSRLMGGDLVFAIRGSIGSVQPVPNELLGSNLTQDAARVSIRRGVNADWLLFALRSQLCQSQVQARATGATIRGLNIRDLKRIVLPVPPRPEQDAIALHLTTTTGHLDELAERVRLAIERLREYRTALISAAVTGKIDVRGFQPSPPCQ